jgi:hypothetical protein
VRRIEFLLSVLVILVLVMAERGCPIELKPWDIPMYTVIYIIILVITHYKGDK